MNKHEILNFLRTSYKRPELEGKTEEEKAFSMIKDFTDALGWKMATTEAGILKKSAISIITDLGMRVITHENGKTNRKSKGMESFAEKAYIVLFLKYNGNESSVLNANFTTDEQDEIYIKDMANLLLAVGYDIKTISTSKRRHQIFLTDVAIANDLPTETISTSYTDTDIWGFIGNYFWWIVIGLAILSYFIF